MKRSVHRFSVAMLFIAAAAILTSCASVGGTEIKGANVAQRVEEARTRDDHERLAAYFQHQAQLQKAQAEECREQRHRIFRTLPSGLYYPPTSSAAITGHYDTLVEGYERNASAYEGLAQAHRQMAAGAGRDGGAGNQ